MIIAMTRKVVAIYGRRGAGKDTLAETFVREGWAHEKFSAPLKDAVAALFSLSADQIHGRPDLGADDPRELPSAWGPTPRRILQHVGTELFQHALAPLLPEVGRAFWARSLVQRVAASADERPVVISDMRFPHELAELRAAGWDVTAVLVRRGSCAPDAHGSETEMDAIVPDRIVDNCGTAADMARIAKQYA